MAPRPPEKAFGDASVVFTGRLRDLDSRLVRGTIRTLKYAWAEVKSVFGGPDPEDLPDSPETYIRVWLEVTDTHKGDLPDEVIVFTGYNDGDCGFPFEKGKSYLVYAFQCEGDLHTNICSRTAPVEWAGDDYKFFATQDHQESADMRPDA